MGLFMQMTTSGYISAFQGLRALWGWWRKNDDASETNEHEQQMNAALDERELALLRANTVREVAAVCVETEGALHRARAQSRRERLQPVMEMYAAVQANKRLRFEAMDDEDTP